MNLQTADCWQRLSWRLAPLNVARKGSFVLDHESWTCLVHYDGPVDTPLEAPQNGFRDVQRRVAVGVSVGVDVGAGVGVWVWVCVCVCVRGCACVGVGVGVGVGVVVRAGVEVDVGARGWVWVWPWVWSSRGCGCVCEWVCACGCECGCGGGCGCACLDWGLKAPLLFLKNAGGAASFHGLGANTLANLGLD